MKKYIAPVLAALLLAGCGKPAPATEPTAAPTTTPVTETTAPATEPETLPITEPTTEPTAAPTTEPTTEPATEPTLKFDPQLCGELFGQWEKTVALDGTLLALPEIEAAEEFSLIWEFDPDGNFSVTCGEEYEAALADYQTAVNEYLMEMRFRIFTAECRLEGLWEWATNQKWEKEGYREQNQAEVDAFMEELNLAGRFEKLLRRGQYHIRDGALVLEYEDGTAVTLDYTLEESSLTLNGLDNESDYILAGLRPPLSLQQSAETEAPSQEPSDPTGETGEMTEPTSE